MKPFVILLKHRFLGDAIVATPLIAAVKQVYPEAPVVVVTRPGPDGALLYRLARPSCQTWNTAAGLRFEPWPPAGSGSPA